MTSDRYTRAVLTVIAIALVYLCVVLTPFPMAAAQTARRPGEFNTSPPGEVVVVGWRAPREDRVAVQVQDSVPLKVTGEVRVGGTVRTRQDLDTADRVVLVGWEESSLAGRPGVPRMLNPDPNSRFVALPVMTIPPR